MCIDISIVIYLIIFQLVPLHLTYLDLQEFSYIQYTFNVFSHSVLAAREQSSLHQRVASFLLPHHTMLHFMTFCRAQLSWIPSTPTRTTISKFFISFLFFALGQKSHMTIVCCMLQVTEEDEGERRHRGTAVSDDLWGVCLSVCVSVSLSVWWFSGVSVCSCQTMWRRLVYSVLSVRVLPQSDFVVVVAVAVTNVVISTQLLSVLASLPLPLSACLLVYRSVCIWNHKQDK